MKKLVTLFWLFSLTTLCVYAHSEYNNTYSQPMFRLPKASDHRPIEYPHRLMKKKQLKHRKKSTHKHHHFGNSHGRNGAGLDSSYQNKHQIPAQQHGRNQINSHH